MDQEREHKKGGKRLSPKGEKAPKPPKPPKKPLTPRQKVLRGVYLAVTILAALVVVVFAVSRVLFVKPEIPTPARQEPKPAASGEVVQTTETPEITGD